MRRLVKHDPLIDEILGSFHENLGRELEAYRGHVYRCFNFACALSGSSRDARDLAIVAVFHDVGIWTDATFDYVRPSVERARRYVLGGHPELDAEAIASMIAWHHKLRSCRAEAGPEGEAFRRADLVDLSFGLVRFGLPRSFVREVRDAFPNAGFHACLLGHAARWIVRNPTRPFPMLEW